MRTRLVSRFGWLYAFAARAHKGASVDLRQIGDLGHFGGDHPASVPFKLKVLILRLEPSLGSSRPTLRDGH